MAVNDQKISIFYLGRDSDIMLIIYRHLRDAR
mgnify:CR=1 FL=1